MKQRLWIIADDYRMACLYAQEKGLSRREWIYGSHVRHTLGYWGGRYVVVSVGGLPHEALDVLKALRKRGFTEEEA